MESTNAGNFGKTNHGTSVTSPGWFEREFELLGARGLVEAEMRRELMARIGRAVPIDDWTVQDLDPGRHLATDCMFSLGFGHELRLAAVTGDTPWAVVHLYRRPERPDFSADELSLLVGCQRALARALGGAIALAAQASTRSAAQGVPATVVLSSAAEMVAAAGPVHEYFGALASVDHSDMPVPAAILSVALAAMTSDGTAPRQLRVLSQTQGWFTLTGAMMCEPGPAGDLVITVAPAHGSELVQLRMRALEFTPGERRVCELVLSGGSTKLIATQLHVSPYTVQDQLKSIFAKARVGSRGELTALLLG